METNSRDYLYSTALLGTILTCTGLVLAGAHAWVLSTMGPYAGIALFFLLALSYGGFTVLVLALLAARAPLRDGDYTMDHSQFALWKAQHVVGELGKLALSLFFPVFARAAFYALFGARVGRQVAVAGKIVDPRLTILDDNCVLGEGCIVTSHTMAQDRFMLRTVHVGRGATVGVGCILMPGVKIGAGAMLLPGSVLKANSEIPAGETWGGIPATRVTVKEHPPEGERISGA